MSEIGRTRRRLRLSFGIFVPNQAYPVIWDDAADVNILPLALVVIVHLNAFPTCRSTESSRFFSSLSLERAQVDCVAMSCLRGCKHCEPHKFLIAIPDDKGRSKPSPVRSNLTFLSTAIISSTAAPSSCPNQHLDTHSSLTTHHNREHALLAIIPSSTPLLPSLLSPFRVSTPPSSNIPIFSSSQDRPQEH
jgi:hypothetical protein